MAWWVGPLVVRVVVGVASLHRAASRSGVPSDFASHRLSDHERLCAALQVAYRAIRGHQNDLMLHTTDPGAMLPSGAHDHAHDRVADPTLIAQADADVCVSARQ